MNEKQITNIMHISVVLGLSLLIYRTLDMTHKTIKKNNYDDHEDLHLILLFIGSLLVFFYAFYHGIWALALLNLLNMTQALIFYIKIHYSY